MVRRFKSDEGGSASIEFVIVFPLIMLVFMSTFEAAVLATRYTMLDRALDIVMREVRLSSDVEITQGPLVQAICANALRVIPDCEDILTVEMTEVNPPNWTLPDANAECVDRINDSKPVNLYPQSGQNKLVLVRACAVVDPWFPTSGLGLALAKDDSGGLQMYSSTAYVAEP